MSILKPAFEQVNVLQNVTIDQHQIYGKRIYGFTCLLLVVWAFLAIKYRISELIQYTIPNRAGRKAILAIQKMAESTLTPIP